MLKSMQISTANMFTFEESQIKCQDKTESFYVKDESFISDENNK